MIRKSTSTLPARAVLGVLAMASCARCQGGSDCAAEEEACLLQPQREPHVKIGSPPAPPLEPVDEESQRARLQRAMPFAWLHAPKCGTSLVNFLVHLPGVCPGVPDDLVISYETFGESHALNFEIQYNATSKDGACPGGFGHLGGHDGVEPHWDAVYSGHAVAMLRQPEQRLISDYSYHGWNWPYDTPARDVLEYAQQLQGCTVRMLVHSGPVKVGCGGRDYGLPTDDEVELAVERLRTGFAFVGLTEEWPLSMCLGHRMFGGRCRTSDFIDTRVTARNGGRTSVRMELHPSPYDVSPLKGFTDPYDGALYKAAQEIFADSLQRYNVSLESCQPCFDEAGIAIDSSA